MLLFTSWQKYISLEYLFVIYKIFVIFYRTASEFEVGRAGRAFLARAAKLLAKNTSFSLLLQISRLSDFSWEIRSRNIFKLGDCSMLPASLVNRKSNWYSYERSSLMGSFVGKMRGKFPGKFPWPFSKAGCDNFFKVPTIVLMLWHNTFIALENGLSNVSSILIRCVSHFASPWDISTIITSTF